MQRKRIHFLTRDFKGRGVIPARSWHEEGNFHTHHQWLRDDQGSDRCHARLGLPLLTRRGAY